MSKSTPSCDDHSFYFVSERRLFSVIDPVQLVLKSEFVINKSVASRKAPFESRSNPYFVKVYKRIPNWSIVDDLIKMYLLSWIWPDARLY